MKTFSLLIATALCVLLSLNLQATVFPVSSQQEFNSAHNTAAENDTIMWAAGIYSDVFMDIDRDRLFITGEELGTTIFTGASRVEINSDYITLEGFQWLNGDIGDEHVIRATGSYNVFTELNISAYMCYKYLIIRAGSQYCVVSHCNFENRLNRADQNILSILVDDTEPGYNKVQYCSFKNFAGGGNDEGVEPIRIGVSSQAEFISRSLVEYCYFTQCNGDGEIISNKARQNVFQYNTFEDNPLAELVLRHGSENIVYGNFFLNGKGGVRVREGQDQYIYNNYFENITDRPIYLQNEDDDPLDNINIAFNTVINSDDIRLGGGGNFEPTNVTFSNNIFVNPQDGNFENETGIENWVGNISFGTLGIPLPANGISEIDPLIEVNEAGYFGLNENSPAIDAAQAGFTPLPQWEGMDPIDTDISLDIMGQTRPASIEEKDLGCNEHPHSILIQPIATEENTGPSYDTDTSPIPIPSSSQNILYNQTTIEIFPNPASNQINISLNILEEANLELGIFDVDGRKLSIFEEQAISPGKTILSRNIEELPNGLYTARVAVTARGIEQIQSITFVKSK